MHQLKGISLQPSDQTPQKEIFKSPLKQNEITKPKEIPVSQIRKISFVFDLLSFSSF